MRVLASFGVKYIKISCKFEFYASKRYVPNEIGILYNETFIHLQKTIPFAFSVHSWEILDGSSSWMTMKKVCRTTRRRPTSGKCDWSRSVKRKKDRKGSLKLFQLSRGPTSKIEESTKETSTVAWFREPQICKEQSLRMDSHFPYPSKWTTLPSFRNQFIIQTATTLPRRTNPLTHNCTIFTKSNWCIHHHPRFSQHSPPSQHGALSLYRRINLAWLYAIWNAPRASLPPLRHL